jgi:DNA-binding protein HU-beta
MSMTKQELIDAIHTDLQAGSTPISKVQVNAVLERLAITAIAQLKAGGDVPLPGLGKLKASQRSARMGRNPSTGASIEIPAKTMVKLSPAKTLLDDLN